MKNKLSYEISEILRCNNYTEIIVKDEKSNKKVDIQYAYIKFRYIPSEDKSYLSFSSSKEKTRFEIEDKEIKEVIIDNESLTIITEGKCYYCYEEVKIMP